MSFPPKRPTPHDWKLSWREPRGDSFLSIYDCHRCGSYIQMEWSGSQPPYDAERYHGVLEDCDEAVVKAVMEA